MITSYDILKTLMRTEKGALQESDRQYLFRVAPKATKVDIKRAVEDVYKVKVESVNTMHLSGKRKRVRQEYGYASAWKKAVVTLKEGHKIEVT